MDIMKRKYTVRNDLAWLGNRLLKKDLADRLGISVGQLYKMRTGRQRIPKEIEEEASRIRFVVPKRRTTKLKLKKKRFKKLKEKENRPYLLVNEQKTEKTLSHYFSFKLDETDNIIANIPFFIEKISKEYKDDEIKNLVTYSCMIERMEQGKFQVESSFNFTKSLIEKLQKDASKLIIKYASDTIEAGQPVRIIIRRTEHFRY